LRHKSLCIEDITLSQVTKYSAEINIVKIYVLYYGVKPLIHQSELRTYTKVVPFQEKNSFHFVVLWKLLNGMEWLKLIIEVKYIGIILS
jgi:hypothetical protein